ncbi:sperm axonemal maintenance protein CFAP97D1-like [Mya arenaria]|uniref:sperm axonemal maintenance protein CFAP97D1-like n=1 Tax=Mya arenaria TaxID=6604 RepID=UPI0022E1F05D|nr:sperm axonemal maintenance protein CFAP97D1-like [Mya arenaria]
MHRAYQSFTPANNVFLKHKWDRDVYKTHRRKVASAKAVIDNSPPREYQHLTVNLKKLHYEAVREATIKRDNRMLNGKMGRIMKIGGYTDHTLSDKYMGKSLNNEKHRRELLRVANENRNILGRLRVREPHYDHHAHLRDWQLSRQYLRNISTFPPPLLLYSRSGNNNNAPTLYPYSVLPALNAEAGRNI